MLSLQLLYTFTPCALHPGCIRCIAQKEDAEGGGVKKLQRQPPHPLVSEAESLTPEVYMQRCVTSLMLQRTVSLSFYAVQSVSAPWVQSTRCIASFYATPEVYMQRVNSL